MEHKKVLPSEQREELLRVLKSRFEKNMHRHKGLDWAAVNAKLDLNPEKVWSLLEMEKTGGEPDVVGYDATTDQYSFCDCAAESPKERRSLCYDPEALAARKENKPKNSATGVATEMGISLLTEDQYRELHQIEHFDTKTSSWLSTPPEIRERGGAIFGDFRYGRVFIYHNGAESYYAARGFRGMLKV